MNRDFVLLWQGQAVSHLGNQAFSVAMMLWTMQATGSASVMGLLMTASSLPGLLLTPIGGTVADRRSRIAIIIACDLVGGAGVTALALVMMRTQEPRVVLPLLFAMAVLSGVVRAFFLPAIHSGIPDLVPRERLAAANSLNQMSMQLSLFAGQALGGVLFRLLGAPLLFLFDGLSFFFAAGFAGFIRAPRSPRSPRSPASGRHPFRDFTHETAEGFRWVWRHTGLRDFLLTASLVNFLGMPILVLFPFYVERRLGAGAEWYGFLLAAISAGSVAGFVLAGTLRLAGAARGRVILVAMLVAPALFGILGLVRLRVPALAVAFAGGLALGVINISLLTSIQQATPAELRGRVMSLLTTVSMGLIPVGMALGGVVGDLTDKNVPLVYGVCGALSVLCVLWLASRRPAREFLAS